MGTQGEGRETAREREGEEKKEKWTPLQTHAATLQHRSLEFCSFRRGK